MTAAPKQSDNQPNGGIRRFVFLGPDSQVQNELAIGFLLDLWRSAQPSTTLHIYGRQRLPWRKVANVVWHGYAETLEEVYSPGSIALAPTFLVGGIKTKILEGWSHGCAVLTNPPGLEGLHIGVYDASVELEQWRELVSRPEEHIGIWRQAATTGSRYVTEHSSDFSQGWSHIISMSASTGELESAAVPEALGRKT